MHPDRWRKIEKIYFNAFELHEAERFAYLESACGDDDELRGEVESLIYETTQNSDFLSDPVLSLGLSLIGDEKRSAATGEKIGHYNIIKRIGRGGMGEVYLAEDQNLDRLVALKILPPEVSDSSIVERFKREARAASAISHPNVAHIYEIGENKGKLFIAMELVEGVTLRERLARAPFTLEQAFDIALQTALGLAAAHKKGIVHRDVKPENIIIRPDDLVKVVDFGLAKLSAPNSPRGDRHGEAKELEAARLTRTQPGLLMGTANYMSPEQARGLETDERTDVWSWGVVFYEMLSGRRPFKGISNTDVIADIIKNDPPSEHFEFSASLARIVRRSLGKNKNERYSNISELIADLRDLRFEFEENGLLAVSLPLTTDRINARLIVRERDSGGLSSIKQPIDENSGSRARRSTFTTSDYRADNETKSFWASLLLRRMRDALPAIIKSPLFAGAVAIQLLAIAVVYYGFVAGEPKHFEKSAAVPQITHLTKNGRIMDAAISPDGRFLAYAPIDSGKQSLWIRDLDSGGDRQILSPDAGAYWGMRFTPNGEELLFIKSQPNVTTNLLYIVSRAGGAPRKLITNIDAPPAVSNDGKRVAFLRSYPTQNRDALSVINIDGSSEYELASRVHPDRFATSSASWSANDEAIAVGGCRRGQNLCAVLNVSVKDSAIAELTEWQWAAIGGMAWNKDELIFSARRKESKVLQIWRLSPSNGQIQNITDEQNAYEEVTLSSAANKLITTYTYETSDIWLRDATGAVRRLTAEGNEGADGLTVTPSGRIVYTVGEYEQSHLWSMDADGGDRRQLTPNTGFLPAAAPNGNLIAYVSSSSGVNHIYLVDENGESKQLTDGGGENYPRFSPDGEWIVYSSLGKDGNSLFKIQTGGNRRTRLTSDGVFIKPVVSPDGNLIAATYRRDENDKWKIAILPISGGAPLKILDLPNPRYQMIRWTPDSRALLYVDKHEGVQNLWRQPLDAAPAEQITKFTEDLILHYESTVSGNETVLSRGGRKRDIALVKNFK